LSFCWSKIQAIAASIRELVVVVRKAGKRILQSGIAAAELRKEIDKQTRKVYGFRKHQTYKNSISIISIEKYSLYYYKACVMCENMEDKIL
jgi:hypothetical protein